MKQTISIFILLFISSLTFGQQFNNITNVETFFTMNKIQVDSILKKEGYKVSSKNIEPGMIEYEKILRLDYYNNFRFSVLATFAGNKLKNFLWNDMAPQFQFIARDIEAANYIIVENKTKDALGIYYLQSSTKNLDLIISKTALNLQNKMIFFHLFKRGK